MVASLEEGEQGIRFAMFRKVHVRSGQPFPNGSFEEVCLYAVYPYKTNDVDCANLKELHTR